MSFYYFIFSDVRDETINAFCNYKDDCHYQSMCQRRTVIQPRAVRHCVIIGLVSIVPINYSKSAAICDTRTMDGTEQINGHFKQKEQRHFTLDVFFFI